jgi:hypothetical protein
VDDLNLKAIGTWHQLESKWKKTSKLKKMEENFNFIVNGR